MSFGDDACGIGHLEDALARRVRSNDGAVRRGG